MKINITEKGKEELEKTMKDKDGNKALKIYVAGYGWGGPSFGLALDEPKEGDIKITSEGYDFLVEEGLEEIYGSFTLDYSDSWLRKGFVVMPDGAAAPSC